MCGIAGVVRFDGRTIQVESLKKMSDVIAHRGPDGDGQWLNPTADVGLAHRRLSIIDLSTCGAQPMEYASDRYHITFNGEIYNYIEIKERLVKAGYEFKSKSDTEVLLALFDQKREKCLEDLDGMFAFAIWDEKEKQLFCARDRFGEKPFYYTNTPQFFAFGSEMKAIWEYNKRKEPNYQMINDYITYGYLTHPQKPHVTFYDGIFQLPPASYLIIQDGKINVKKYWQLDLNRKSKISFDDAQGTFRELFKTSLERRLRSDVPVGSSLSGGLDSSLIVCLINEIMEGTGSRVNTFSARFKDFAKDEGKFMQYVIDKTNANPHFVFSESDLLSEIDKVFYHQEEPYGSASILVQNKVFELAKNNGVTVLLDGQGADEILAGYTYYYQTYFNELGVSDPLKQKNQIELYRQIHPNNEIFLQSIESKNQSYLKTAIKKSLPGLKRNIPRLLALKREIFRRFNQENTYHLNKDLYNKFKNSAPPTFDYDPYNLSSHLNINTTKYGLETLLRYADRNSMAHSREVRLPFLNHDLVEFLFSLPSDYKIHNGWTKYLMRNAFEDLMPPEITWRKDKIGYEPPQKEWMAKPNTVDIIMEARKKLVQKNILDPSILDKVPVATGVNVIGDKSWEHLMIAKLVE